MVRVAVVGAGIIGLSSAIAIQARIPGAAVTLISDKFTPNTTGDGAAGLWSPYLLGDTDPRLIAKWSKETHDLFFRLWKTPEGGALGISLIPIFRVSSDPNFSPPEWKDNVFGFRDMNEAEIRRLNKPSLKKGFAFTTFTCEARKILPHFQKQFERAGGRVVKRRVENLRSLRKDFDIVVHCTGLEACNLVGDKAVYAIRGQVSRVAAPGILYAVLDEDEDGRYIIPNQESVVIGGTHQVNDWNLSPVDSDTEFIEEGCFKMIPSLKDAKVLHKWVGLRPGRTRVRLEVEKLNIPGEPKPLTVIHNYGHAGSGVTLFWGCAQDTATLVQNSVNSDSEARFKLSKL